jgi:transposase
MAVAALGIDVAKDTVAVALLTGDQTFQASFPNTAEGAARLVVWLQKRHIGQVHACLEATGTYGDDLALALHVAGHMVSVVNPSRIAAYAKSQLARHKTDQVDALLIARFCLKEEPALWTPPRPEVRELRALVRHVDAVQVMRRMELNRLKAGQHPPVVAQAINAHLAFLDAQISELHAQIDAHIDGDAELKRQRDLLVTIKGIGRRTAASLVAEIGDVRAFANARALAAYAGLNPRQFRSGTSIRRRTRLSKQGNGALRKALYFPAIVAKQHNPVVRPFCVRLSAAGKQPMVVVGAAMRKLLHIVYGVLNSGLPFDAQATLLGQAG